MERVAHRPNRDEYRFFAAQVCSISDTLVPLDYIQLPLTLAGACSKFSPPISLVQFRRRSL